jgi:hypothetical protein
MRVIHGIRTRLASIIYCTELGTLIELSIRNFDNKFELTDGGVLRRGQEIWETQLQGN